MADDLEPNFLLDQNVSLASDDELGATADAQPTNPHRSLEDEDDFALEGEWNGLTTQGSPSQDTEDPKATKKRKKKERQKENKAKVSLLRIRKDGLVRARTDIFCLKHQTLPIEKALARRAAAGAGARRAIRFGQGRSSGCPGSRSSHWRIGEPGKPKSCRHC